MGKVSAAQVLSQGASGFSGMEWWNEIEWECMHGIANVYAGLFHHFWYTVMQVRRAALEVYNTFTWANEDDKQKADIIQAKFEAYCIPRTNTTWE